MGRECRARQGLHGSGQSGGIPLVTGGWTVADISMLDGGPDSLPILVTIFAVSVTNAGMMMVSVMGTSVNDVPLCVATLCTLIR